MAIGRYSKKRMRERTPPKTRRKRNKAFRKTTKRSRGAAVRKTANVFRPFDMGERAIWLSREQYSEALYAFLKSNETSSPFVMSKAEAVKWLGTHCKLPNEKITVILSYPDFREIIALQKKPPK